MLNEKTLKARCNNPFSMFEFRRQFFLVSAPILLSFSPTALHISARSLICCLSRLSVVISGIVLGCLLCPATLNRRLCATCGSASHAFHRPHLTTQAPPPRAPQPIVCARAGGVPHVCWPIVRRLAPDVTIALGSTPGSPTPAHGPGTQRLQVEAQWPYSVIRLPQKNGGSTCQTPMETVGGTGSSLEDVARRL